jgi:hypothetical protein
LGKQFDFFEQARNISGGSIPYFIPIDKITGVDKVSRIPAISDQGICG